MVAPTEKMLFGHHQKKSTFSPSPHEKNFATSMVELKTITRNAVTRSSWGWHNDIGWNEL